MSFQDKKSRQNVAYVGMNQNRMFPLDVSCVEKKALVAKTCTESDVWYLRYGHLHENGLKILNQKDMVVGLPIVKSVEFCEACVMGKQSQNSFPLESLGGRLSILS